MMKFQFILELKVGAANISKGIISDHIILNKNMSINETNFQDRQNI